MSAPELPSELTGHMATLRGECDAHAKARAVAARSSGKAHLAAVMGNALSRRLGKDSDLDVADFVKQHNDTANGAMSRPWDGTERDGTLATVGSFSLEPTT